MHVLVVNPGNDSLPKGTDQALTEAGWTLSIAPDYRRACQTLRSHDVDVVIAPESAPAGVAADRCPDLAELIGLIETQRLPAVLLGDEANNPTSSTSMLERVSRDITPAELRGRLAMIERYHAHFQRAERELGRMEQLGKQLTNHFNEVDREMRLAARLQREYLPELDKPIGNVQFRSLYRPATWVSGDMFGVFPVDENHTGFYVADVVGHGVSASLLTLYIKQALEPSPMASRSSIQLDPSQALHSLNAALVQLSLPSCQFVTACYAVLDHRTRTLAYAGAGHPYPLRLAPGGRVAELTAPGGLLGLSKDATFDTCQVQLDVGDRLLLYTDGLELAFQEAGEAPFQRTRYLEYLESLADKPLEELLSCLDQALDRDTGSLHPRDDVTVLGLEILER